MNDALTDALRGTERLRACERPYWVKGKDGEWWSMPCGAKRERSCSFCYWRYKNDSKRIIGSGMVPSVRDGISEAMLAGYEFYWLTFTAPSFGAVHRGTSKENGKACPCGRGNQKGHDRLVGTPRKGVVYDYAGMVEWNGASSELFRRTMDKAKKRLAKAGVEDFAFVSAREWQTRGAIHFHVVVRVPKASTKAVEPVLKDARNTEYQDKGRGVRVCWGKRFDLQKVGHGVEDVKKLVRYLAKLVGYTVKAANERLSLPQWEHVREIVKAARTMRCPKQNCCHTFTGEDGWEYTDKLGRAHKNFGFAGVLYQPSRNWSFAGLTRQKLHEERKAAAIAARARREADIPREHEREEADDVAAAYGDPAPGEELFVPAPGDETEHAQGGRPGRGPAAESLHAVRWSAVSFCAYFRCLGSRVWRAFSSLWSQGP